MDYEQYTLSNYDKPPTDINMTEDDILAFYKLEQGDDDVMTYIDKFHLKLVKLLDGFLSEQGKGGRFMLGLHEQIQK